MRGQAACPILRYACTSVRRSSQGAELPEGMKLDVSFTILEQV
jgi:hypothetical protein